MSVSRDGVYVADAQATPMLAVTRKVDSLAGDIRTAMREKKKIGEIAQSILTASELLK